MERETRKKLNDLVELIVKQMDQVRVLADNPNHTVSEGVACHEAIEELSKTYRAILEAAPQEDQLTIERRYGRRLMNLRQQASFLPSPAKGASVKTVQNASWESMFKSASGNNSGAPQWVASLDGPAPGEFRVGRDVDSWCGHCGGLREHTISALVDDKPKVVICNTCGARHNYRLKPVRRRKKDDDAPQQSSVPSRQRQPNSKAARAEAARVALQKELAEATEVRPFAPRVRYKSGEIVEHPEYGRGKVENVLRGRVHIRFRSGLKSLSTM